MKMTQRNQDYVPVLTMLVILIGTMILFIKLKILGSQGETIATILIGMLAVAMISAISRVFERDTPAKFAVHFDGVRARHSLSEIMDAEFEEIVREEANESRSWEPTTSGLFMQDPNLALAKLRIDLERELRRLSVDADLPLDRRRMSITALLRDLSRRKLLDPQVISAISDIIPVCNSAVHGSDIDNEIATQVLEIGDDIIRVLKTYPKTHEDDKNQPSMQISS